MSEKVSLQTISEAMFKRLAELETKVADIDGLIIITVHSAGITPDVFYKPGGRMLLLAGLELAKTDLIDMMKEDKNGQNPIVNMRK